MVEIGEVGSWAAEGSEVGGMEVISIYQQERPCEEEGKELWEHGGGVEVVGR